MPIHFGVKIIEGKYGFNLTRENYAIINTKSSFSRIMRCCDYANKKDKIYSNEWCNEHFDNCMKNFDLNMEYFALLDHSKLNEEINKFLENNRNFVEVSDINIYNMKSGYYIMVLDEYSQLYIGTTENIKKRIREHWVSRKSFDRLLFPIGSVDTSIMSIESFRALDTTRIFVYETEDLYDEEDYLINKFSTKFICNRISGGRITYGLQQAILMMKNRNL